MKPRFFKTSKEFRAWLEKHHTTAAELIVGFYKKKTRKPSITWPESVDEALAFGWIDGIRRSIDDESYCIRFTPRRRGSVWSVVNTKRVAVLTRQGRMHEAGLKAFHARDPRKTKLYSFERKPVMPQEYESRLRANADAWAYLETAPPYYKRIVANWVTSARQEDTRQKRLLKLIEYSARRERVPF